MYIDRNKYYYHSEKKGSYSEFIFINVQPDKLKDKFFIKVKHESPVQIKSEIFEIFLQFYSLFSISSFFKPKIARTRRCTKKTIVRADLELPAAGLLCPHKQRSVH